jgi:hypothetical protein
MAPKSLGTRHPALRHSKKRPFSRFRGPKFALLTPLFPPKPPKNPPFCAHFRTPFFGQSAPFSDFGSCDFKFAILDFRFPGGRAPAHGVPRAAWKSRKIERRILRYLLL